MRSDAMAPPSRRWSLTRGRVMLRSLRSTPAQEYLLFIPDIDVEKAPVLVAVHGTSRNVYEHAACFASVCEKRGVVLVVPIFTSEQNKGYQRLGQGSRDQRADLVLNRCLSEAAFLSGADVTQVRLFGFSGGAQFVHRYVFAHPERVVKAVVAAAGWYTFPDHRVRYPYGIRPNRKLPNVMFNPERFLKVPVDVFVGEQDIGSVNLRTTDRVNKQQGPNRLERARNWVEAMRGAAAEYGLESGVTLTVVPEVDHSFRQFCDRGGLIERIMASLFGTVAGVHGDTKDVDQDVDTDQSATG